MIDSFFISGMFENHFLYMWEPKHFGTILGNIDPKLSSNREIDIPGIHPHIDYTHIGTFYPR